MVKICTTICILFRLLFFKIAYVLEIYYAKLVFTLSSIKLDLFHGKEARFFKKRLSNVEGQNFMVYSFK